MRQLVCAVALVAAVACFGDTEIDLRIKGQMTKVRSRETPTLVVNSLDEVKAHYAEVRDLLPPTPFIMDGQWVVRLDADGPKTFPDRADAEEFFSPNGEYVLQVQQLKTREGWPGVQKEWLLGTDGKRYWERECKWSSPWVLDSGRVADLRPDDISNDMGTSSVEVLDRDTAQTVRRLAVGDFYTRAYACAAAGLLLVDDDDLLTAIDQQGNRAWQVRLGSLRTQAGLVTAPLGLDPLGRGLCFLSLAQPRGLSVVALNPATGGFMSALVRDLPPSSPKGWSPRGTVVPLTTEGGVGLVDWADGKVLFAQSPGPEARYRDVRVHDRDSVTASDRPARVAAPLWADCVFDRTGRLIWYNHVASGTSRRLVLSSDGMRLGTVLWDWAERGCGPVVNSVVVYALPADGQALRGL